MQKEIGSIFSVPGYEFESNKSNDKEENLFFFLFMP